MTLSLPEVAVYQKGHKGVSKVCYTKKNWKIMKTSFENSKNQLLVKDAFVM